MVSDEKGKVSLSWHIAFAGDYPISHYEVLNNGIRIGEVKHKPQTQKKKLFVYVVEDRDLSALEVTTVDEAGNRASAKFV